MNTSLTAYTHLESLLLFHSLTVHGLANNAFSRISELLKSNPSITSDKRFQSGRLSPDALRNFCLHILKEEERSEQRQDGALGTDGQNGEVRNSRKRKAPSPSYPTVQEAARHAHLIPKLITKLYARYRTAITNEIRDDEERYERLQGELQSLERGERDSELLEKANGQSPVLRSPPLPRRSPLLRQKPASSSPNPQLAARDEGTHAAPLPNARIVDGPEQPTNDAPTPLPPPNGQAEAGRIAKDAPIPPSGTKQGTPSSTSQPLHSPVPVPSPPPQSRTPEPLAPSQIPKPQPTPALPAPAEYNELTPHPLQSPYPPQVQHAAQVPPGAPPPASPHAVGQAPPPPLPPAHTPVTIPPHGVQFQPQPMQPYRRNGGPQPIVIPGQPLSFPPSTQGLQAPFPPRPQSPSIQTPQPPRNFPPSGALYPPTQQPQVAQPSPQGGVMLPPFQVSPQDPSRAQQPLPHYPQVSTPLARPPLTSANAIPSPTAVVRQSLPPTQPPGYDARGSVSTPIRAPHIATGTPRSARSVWKHIGTRPTAPLERPSPSWEPIMDVPPQEPPQDPPKKSQSRAKAPRRPRGKGKGKEKEADKEAEKEAEIENEAQPEPEQSEEQEQVPEMETRQGRSRRKGTLKRTRPGSIASTRTGGSTRGRSRSQSALSHTDTITGEIESQAGPRIKTERGTSHDVIDEGSVGTPQPTTTTRRQGRAAQSQPPAKGRNKRTAREASLAESEDHDAAKLVIAPRHFSRMCNPIMNDIGSHKHASTFTTAVKAKNAEGYYDIIKRPTDLKSIQKAIAAGAKIVASAAAASDSSTAGTASPGNSGGVVELPLSAEVIPPKAVVNSAQLENELMRMFVNAVMFNPGEEGVVEDAREMFETCQQSVSNWRSAERSSGVIEETPPVVLEEEAQPTASKRRKV